MDDAQLLTIWQQRRTSTPAVPLAQPLVQFMKHKLSKKVRQLGKLAKVWDKLLPAGVHEHTALDGYHQGVLTVIVDSAAHRFQLRTLLDSGLAAVIQSQFGGPINKIKLTPGQFYDLDSQTNQPIPASTKSIDQTNVCR
ncbi:MAG: DUF721 domain-containing protein [Planctomycetes bacterium]|nr:DUF721 domain-containing protein [Planctomycetota bacterium]